MKKIKLSDIPKKEPFEAPEGYLEKLPYLVQQRLQEKPAVRKWHWLLQPQLQLGLATVVLLLVGAVLFFNQNQPVEQEPNAQALLEEVSEQELLQYLQSSTNRLSMQEINSVADWQDDDDFLQHLPEDKALEDEVLKNIDTYTADEIWR